MLFEFIDIAYSFTILLLIIVFFIVKQPVKKYINNCIAVSNTLLIGYSWYLSYQLYKLIQLALSLKIKVDPKNPPPIQITWFEIRYLLLIVLPYIFIIKKLSANKILASGMLLILQWDVAVNLFHTIFNKETNSGLLFYFPYLGEYKILNYISLFIAVYALLWLLKKLPSQQVKK